MGTMNEHRIIDFTEADTSGGADVDHARPNSSIRTSSEAVELIYFHGGYSVCAPSISDDPAAPDQLNHVTSIRCRLKYVSWGYRGAVNHPWLQETVINRLKRVDQMIQEQTEGLGRLLIWDALRSLETQTDIFERYYQEVRSSYPEKSEAEVQDIVASKVRRPSQDKPPPHTTGGAVDVTIWINDTENALGKFDDFSPFGRADYFSSVAPRTAEEFEIARLRSILRNAMLSQDFVGIDEEWWHFEFGTRFWAEQRHTLPSFDTILSPPSIDAVAFGGPRTPPRQLQISTGVAQVFPSASDRSLALRGKTDGRYYARTRHSNERYLAGQLCSLIGAEDAVLLPSGLAAIVSTVMAFVPRNGRLLLDHYTYYETVKSLRTFGECLGWQIQMADLSDAEAIARLDLEDTAAIVFDHPRNWILNSPNIVEIRKAASRSNAVVIADTSVQPLQRLIDQSLADIVVFSLSKYPSLGETIAGVALGRHERLAPVRQMSSLMGLTIAPETAATVSRHVPTLNSRILSVSSTANQVVNFLRTVPFVEDVRLPDLSSVQALPGGQVTFVVASDVATRTEQIITANALDPLFPLAFACTFGTAFTTFEHFEARNTQEIQTSAGSEYIEPGRIRLGIGHEEASHIIEALRFVLYAARFE